MLRRKIYLQWLVIFSLTLSVLFGGRVIFAESNTLDPDTLDIPTAVAITAEENSSEETTPSINTSTNSQIDSSSETSDTTHTTSETSGATSATSPAATTTNKSTSSNTTTTPAPKPTPAPAVTTKVSTAKATPEPTSGTTPSLTSSSSENISPTPTLTTTPTPTPSTTPTPTPTPAPVDESLSGMSSVNIPLHDVYISGPRLTAPTKDNAYYFASNPFARAGFPMPNCTTYAYGRAWELLGTRPNLSTRDAHYFWGDNIRSQTYPYGQEPRVGAIVCWNSGELGHVAIVEEIQGDKILISESVWKGSYFNTRWIAKSTPSLQGYIYIANFTEEVFSEQPENQDFVARILTEDGKLALAADGRSIALESATLSSSAQYWRISLGNNGFYEIRNANGFVMDVAGALDRDGVSIQLDDKTSSKGQAWKISSEKKLITIEPQYTARKISLLDAKQVQIYAQETAADNKAKQKFTFERVESPVLKVLPSLRTNVVNFSLQSSSSDKTEAYIKIYKEAFGKGSAVIESIVAGQDLSLALDPGYYEVCVEIGAGQALINTEIQSFTLSVPNSEKFLAQ